MSKKATRPRIFGALVVGSPGSGKSTMIRGLREFFQSMNRTVVCINLDPACDSELLFDCEIDIRSLVQLEDCMQAFELGPNGGLMYCMEYLIANLDWLEREMAAKCQDDTYCLIDFAGQAELFSGSNQSINQLFNWFRTYSSHFCVVHCTDATQMTEEASLLAGALSAMAAMANIELPQVNLLTKSDLVNEEVIESIVEADDFTQMISNARDLRELELYDSDYYDEDVDDDDNDDTVTQTDNQSNHQSNRWPALTERLCEMIDSYGLVSYIPVAVESKQQMWRAIEKMDTSNGYQYAHGKQTVSMFNALQREQQQHSSMAGINKGR